MSNKPGKTDSKRSTARKRNGNGVKSPPASPVPTAALPSVPPSSVAKAKAAFANFSTSRFAQGARPASYVAPGQSTAEAQRQSLARQIERLPLNGALSVALPAAQLESLLPSYDKSRGTVSLDDVMKALEQNMRGHEFFSNGEPTLNRLAIQSRVRDIMSVLKGVSK